MERLRGRFAAPCSRRSNATRSQCGSIAATSATTATSSWYEYAPTKTILARSFSSSPTTTGGGGGGSKIASAAPTSMLRRVWKSLTTDNDDFVNKYKIQERKDLYYLLLVTKLREVRLENPDKEYMEAFDQAFGELEKRDLDSMSNVQLRYEMQDVLGLQVLDIFDTFDEVDQTIDEEIFQEDPPADLLSQHDYSVYKEVLTDDYEASAARLEKCKSSPDLTSTDAVSVQLKRTIAFLERKVGALRSILAFHGWVDEGSGDWATSFPTDLDDEMDDFGFRVTTADEDTFTAIRQYQTINMYRAAMLRKELGYSVIALKSLIPGAGRGVFIDGTALAGSLVAFQPGPIWPLGSVRPDVEEHFQDNPNLQLSMRYDQFIIDSRRSPYTVLTRPRSNPFALGHVVNHPQGGALPNCQSVMLNFTSVMELKNLHRYVPNSYAVPPAWINRTFDRYVIEMHSMCLLTRRDAEDEELAYDYRLMGGDMPRWYQKVDYPKDD